MLRKKQYGKITMLTLNVSYACSILAFLTSLYYCFYLDINGVIFKSLLAYSFFNLINTLLFYKHERLVITYNIMSLLAFIISYMLCLYGGGINSPFISFLVLIIFSGYMTNKFYGNLWMIIITISAFSLYYISVSDIEIVGNIAEESMEEFNLSFLLFLIILLGGVFGRIMNKNNEKVNQTRKELIQREEEKTVMLREIHHRVKNNLHVVNSLLRIQSRDIVDDKVEMMFKAAQSRIVAMARIHEKIYKTNNLKDIEVNDHFKLLIDDLMISYNIETQIVPNLNIDPIKISIDNLLPLSLIINELISNSLKHAFTNKKTGEITVNLKRKSDDNYELLVSDNGVGMSQEVFKAKKSTGIKLIHSFVKQLNGDIEMITDCNGTCFKIWFEDKGK
ncbi:sensor histidine kinase [Flavobacteriaceae bacterium R38]|nr:sensor histidine kinase [Flavobacteriaceae bacterium R38]